jgi:hypothetical protein
LISADESGKKIRNDERKNRMSAVSESLAPESPKFYRPIIMGGLIAGALDITSAFINSGLRGRSPMWVLQSVASGLLGADSYKGGFATAALGTALHFLIALTATSVFYAASRKLKFMTERPIISGILYGAAVYLFMYFIVLRLAFSGMTYTAASVATNLGIHIFCVGLPISLAVRRFSAAPLVLSLLALMLVGSWSARGADGAIQSQEPTAAKPVVLVELFTSEGCSSCPPADKLLADLDQNQPIKGAQVIALSEHVDYWNRLGWKDPFSSAEFSRRQSEYARAFGGKDIYTPQMVVDGQAEFVGSNLAAARAAILKAALSPKANIGLTIKSSSPKSVTLAVQVENIPAISSGDTADVMLAITESGLSSNVSKGENSGRKLAHSAVTRKLVKIGSISGNSFSAERTIDLDSNWKRENMKAVAFAQERTSRRAIGASAIRLEGEL